MSLLRRLRPVCTCLTSEGPVASTSRRMLHAAASTPAESLIPKPRGIYQTPHDILANAGTRRNLEQYESKLGDWNSLFSKRGQDLKELGLPPKERRYLLWVLEKFRQGQDVADVAVGLKPKKKVRGWGAKVQKGIRVR